MPKEAQFIAFIVNGEEYAINIVSVQEIIRVLEATRVPHASPFISGVINLRGMVIPVMDIRKRFGLPGKMPDEASRIVITNWQASFVGILVDCVSEVIRLSGSAIAPPPVCSSNINSEFFSGIGKLDNRLLIILNLDQVLNFYPEI